VQEEEGLELPDDLPAGGGALEQLPKPAPEGAINAEDAKPRVGLVGVLREKGVWQSRGEAIFDLREGSLAQRTQRGGKRTSPSGASIARMAGKKGTEEEASGG